MINSKQQTKVRNVKSGRDEGLIQKKNPKGNSEWYARIVRHDAGRH